MKKYLLIFILTLSFIGVKSQPLPPEAVLDLENINCIGNTISFDLSLTLDGVPLISQGSNGFEFGNMDGSETYFEFTTQGGPMDPGEFDILYGTVLDMLPLSTSLEPGITCEELVNFTAYMNAYPRLNFSPLNGTQISYSASSDPENEYSDVLDFDLNFIPTLGQWGLIVLGLSLLIGGVISVRRKILQA